MFHKFIYNRIIYSRRIKLAAAFLLKSSITKSLPYRYLYARKINNTVKKYQRIPERVMIENTNICNANCVFCPHKVMKRKVGVMDLALSKKIISECRQLNINYLTIYGFG